MKTKEELAALKEEVDNLNKKLGELTDDELEVVTGGQSQLDKYIRILVENDKKLVDTGTGIKLELNPTIKYEKEGNVEIILRDKPDA